MVAKPVCRLPSEEIETQAETSSARESVLTGLDRLFGLAGSISSTRLLRRWASLIFGAKVKEIEGRYDIERLCEVTKMSRGCFS